MPRRSFAARLAGIGRLVGRGFRRLNRRARMEAGAESILKTSGRRNQRDIEYDGCVSVHRTAGSLPKAASEKKRIYVACRSACVRDGQELRQSILLLLSPVGHIAAHEQIGSGCERIGAIMRILLGITGASGAIYAQR